jgi:two-component SAPR family response regulator
MRKARELLAFLAVQHPDGASGDAISEALWPESDPARAAGQRNLALRKAREMLRTATGLPEPRWIPNVSGRYRLDPALTGTDLEAFGEALEAARSASGGARLAACRRADALYHGEPAEGAGYEWAEPYAETTSTCTCGSCGCRPQRAARRPSAGPGPAGVETHGSRPYAELSGQAGRSRPAGRRTRARPAAAVGSEDQ